MRIQLLALLILILPCALTTDAQQHQPLFSHHLLPVPAKLEFRTGRLAIKRSLTVAVKGYQDERLVNNIWRAVKRLEGRTELELPRIFESDAAKASLLIECQGAGATIPSLGEDESYTLEVSDTQALLRAPTVVGALRGLETFLQLLESDREGYFIPAVSIQDQPRFRWRGLMIDAARHYQPLEVIRRNLDAMAAVKLNVFHWHLTDDQGFRVESKKYPKLYSMGSDGLYYTQDEIRSVIAYARERGIRVVPEFDMPGHATSWAVGHPELASAPGPYKIERQAGIFDPTLDPTREEVYQLLDGLLGEMAELFPDEYIHIGGDENEGKQWDRNPQIQAFMKKQGIKDNHSLQAYFTLRLVRILKNRGKKVMGWDEILHPDLPKDIVVHSWRGPQSLAEAAKKGYSGVLSNGYYIDLMYPASKHYLVDPIPAESTLTEQQAAFILGGEATMWSEYVSPETIDSRIWPRTAAIAERLWSPRTVNDVDDMYRRLDRVSIQLEELGLTHERNTAVLLRRLARSPEVEPLKTLISVIEPVKQYNRGKMHPTTMLAPLTSLVDAARADPVVARNFAAMADGLLADAPRFQNNREELRHLLTCWRDVWPAMEVLIARSAMLRESEPLAKELSELGAAGLEALSYLSSGTSPTKEWREARMALLARAARPRAAVEFAIIPTIRQLILAAAEMSQLKAESAQEWQRRVKMMARENEDKRTK